jgi:type II secretory pathway predicted ATPase ExeA
MTPDEHHHVIDELQAVIDDTQATLKRFEESGLEGDMPEDYEKLLAILDDAVKQQREHTKAMLGTGEGDQPPAGD